VLSAKREHHWSVQDPVDPLQLGLAYAKNIRQSGKTIYDPIEVGDPNFWIPSLEMEALLNSRMSGLDVSGLALRTRSKVLKTAVCQALEYPVPTSFVKTQPRFPGQNFDTYGQKANNLQVWNEELSPTRRYVLIQVRPDESVGRVRVIAGDTLALLDTTGTLTKKYQARLVVGSQDVELISAYDTEVVTMASSVNADLSLPLVGPVDPPKAGMLLPIQEIFDRLKGLIGATFKDRGSDQERNRGSDLHRLICRALGYTTYADTGQFPDVRHQLLEVKLQTSPTIDLGLVRPDSKEPLDVPKINDRQIRHCDVRYAVFYAKIVAGNVTLTNLYLTPGDSFFSRFTQFGGKVVNGKIQMHLPSNFFS
jgi:hypothetical protein